MKIIFENKFHNNKLIIIRLNININVNVMRKK